MLQKRSVISVVYPDGRLSGHVCEAIATRMLKARVAHAVGKGRHVRSIQLEDGPTRPHAGTRYSHARSTLHNPAGVWTLMYLSPRLAPLFRVVQTSCLSPLRDPARKQAAAN